MTHQDTSLRDLHAQLHLKCLELSARASAMIDFASAGDDTAFVKAMIEESARAVEFWTVEILARVQ